MINTESLWLIPEWGCKYRTFSGKQGAIGNIFANSSENLIVRVSLALLPPCCGCCVAYLVSIFATPLRLLRRNSGAYLQRRYGCCVAHSNILQLIIAEFVRSLNPNAAYAKCSLRHLNPEAAYVKCALSQLLPYAAYAKCSLITAMGIVVLLQLNE